MLANLRNMFATYLLIITSLYAYRVWLLSDYHHGVLGYLVVSGFICRSDPWIVTNN
jgi:hypothetical protein